MNHIKETLEQSKARTTALVSGINQNLIPSWSEKEILYVDAYFAFLRYKADLLIQPKEKEVLYLQEERNREYLAALLGCRKETEFTVMIERLQLAVSERLNELKRYQWQIAGENGRYVYHTSAVKDLSFLKASERKETMYRNEVVDAVFGTTDFEQLILYLGRAAAGGMYVTGNGQICVYPVNPVAGIQGQELILKYPVYLYRADIRYFEPVIDFRVRDHQAKFCFEHEWIARRPAVPCEGEKIEKISFENWRKHKIYYSTGLQDESSLSEEYKKAMNDAELEATTRRLVCEKKIVQDSVATGS